MVCGEVGTLGVGGSLDSVSEGEFGTFLGPVEGV